MICVQMFNYDSMTKREYSITEPRLNLARFEMVWLRCCFHSPVSIVDITNKERWRLMVLRPWVRSVRAQYQSVSDNKHKSDRKFFNNIPMQRRNSIHRLFVYVQIVLSTILDTPSNERNVRYMCDSIAPIIKYMRKCGKCAFGIWRFTSLGKE
jgi:hypothetical protein